MAEKEITNVIKLQIEAGKATPAPPVGPALGSSGVNIMQFVKEFNDRTANQPGMTIPVVISVYKDKSFSFITKVPPVAVLIKKALKIQKGSGKPNRDKVGTITKAQVEEIAKQKEYKTVEELQKKIDSLNLPYQVVNGGLSGETSAAGKSRIDWLLKKPIKKPLFS